MDYSNFINEIAIKYGYDKNLKRAIEIVLPLLIRKHGKKKTDDVLALFNDVKIFATQDMSTKNFDKIREIMTKDINKDIIEEAPSGKNQILDSNYFYQSVYDENMEITGEIRWIIIDKIDKYRKDGYIEIFDTDINVPHFLHELEHAYGMKQPTCERVDNKIISKHGMFETVEEVEKTENGIIVRRVSEKGRILEEMINEKNTIEMLVDYFCVKDYKELKNILNEIGHIPYIYEGTLVSITERLEEAIGKENLDNLRCENNEAVREMFNDECRKTQIANKYFKDENAFNYLEKVANEIYEIKRNCFHIPVEEYLEKNIKLLLDALAVTSAYNEALEIMTFEEYEEIRNKALSKQEETNEQPSV